MKKSLFMSVVGMQIVFYMLLLLVCNICYANDCAEFKPLSLSEISVGGWMEKQIERDITSGYITVYEQLQPTMGKNAFGPQKAKNYSISKTGEWETRRETWWPGEHEGYFAESVVRSAFLTQNEKWLQKAKSIIDNVLKYQEDNGYIGIYDEECRLDNLLNENGELWTQSRILSAILAYYEYTADEKYLKAAKKAADYTIARYTASGKTYFQQPKPNGGGLTHGLMFVDIMEWLYRLTGDKKYVHFGDWLYADYNKAAPAIKNVDNQMDNLLNRDRLFLEHAVHVAEHTRVLFWLASVTGKPEYRNAVESIYYKYKCSQCPTGTLAMDTKIQENVAGNYGSAWLPYEYCTITESVISFSSALQKDGNAEFGDMVENMAFNAGQAARLPDGKAISYATKDNRFDAILANGERYQMAACHKTACCNLQAAKLMPYYVANMWMKKHDDKGIALALYGESKVETMLNNVCVKITESTNYPFDNKVQLLIEPKKEVKFTLTLRKPKWSENTKVNVPNAVVKETAGWITIEKKWKQGDKVELTFDDAILVKRFIDNEIYFQKGCLLYALPIAEKRVVETDFGNGFAKFDMIPADETRAKDLFDNYLLPANIDHILRIKKNAKLYSFSENAAFNADYPYDQPFGFIQVKFIRKPDNKEENVNLIPIGSAVLRKLTFKEDK